MFNQLKFLSAVLLVLAILVYYVTQTAQNQMYDDEHWLLPQLQDARVIAQIDKIEFKAGKSSFYLNRRNRIWHINDGFYVNMESLMSLVQSLRNAKKKEAKTNNPNNFKRLQITDNDWSITIFADGHKLAGLQLGKPGHAADTMFVRMIGEQQSWLVTDFKPLSYNRTDWQLKNILNIPAQEVISLTIKHHNGKLLKLARDSQSKVMKLIDTSDSRLQEHFDSSNLANDLAAGLSHFIIERAEPKQLNPHSKAIELKYQLINGKSVALKLFQASNQTHWAIIDSEKLTNWQLQIPEFKFDLFKQTMIASSKPDRIQATINAEIK